MSSERRETSRRPSTFVSLRFGCKIHMYCCLLLLLPLLTVVEYTHLSIMLVGRKSVPNTTKTCRLTPGSRHINEQRQLVLVPGRNSSIIPARSPSPKLTRIHTCFFRTRAPKSTQLKSKLSKELCRWPDAKVDDKTRCREIETVPIALHFEKCKMMCS